MLKKPCGDNKFLAENLPLVGIFYEDLSGYTRSVPHSRICSSQF